MFTRFISVETDKGDEEIYIYLQKQPDDSLYKLKIIPAGDLMYKIIQKQFD